VKVLQALYAYHQSEVKDKRSAKSFLKKSILGIEDTFINVMQFASELFLFVKMKHNPIDKHLKAKDEEILNYNLLSKNSCLDLMETHPLTRDIFSQPSYNWTRDEDFMVLIYKQISDADWFREMADGYSEDFEKNKQFLAHLYKYLVEISEDFSIKMEEINIHWQDEKIPVIKSIEKLLKTCKVDGEDMEVPLISKDIQDDLEYAEKLLDLAASKHEKYEELISQRTPEWDSERIARMDLYIMVLAIAEFLEFPSIPVKVTINEYLELAKIYSTPQSSKFINGILDKLLTELKLEGKVQKSGRGLVE